MTAPAIDARRWLEEAPCAYLITTPDGEIRWANRTFAGWIGDETMELTGRSIHDVLTATGRIHYESIAPSLALNGELTDVSLDVSRLDGTTLHLLCHATAEAPDGEIWWAGLDVTERRAYERELVVAQRRLRRLQDLSAALVGATDADAVADALLRLLVDGVKADDGAVLLVGGDDRGLQVAATRSATGKGPAIDDLLAVEAHVETALREGRAVFAADELRVTDPPDPLRPGTWHVAVLPLQGDDRVLGVVRFGLDRQHPHTPDERQLLQSAVDITAQSLERVQLLERLRSDAVRNRSGAQLLQRLQEVTTPDARAQLAADFAVPRFADFATVELIGSREPIGLRHRDRSMEGTLRWLRSNVEVPPEQPHSLALGRDMRAPQVVNDIDEALYGRYGLDDAQLAALTKLAPTAYLGLPLIAHGQVIGSLMLAHSTSGRRYTEVDVEFFDRLADGIALALENARLYQHERNVAQQLQTALLPDSLPADPRVRLTSFYEAGHEAAMIGGDWYDAFQLGDDRLGLVVGDVVGGGLAAATTMAELRVALYAYALDGHGVADVLARVHRFATTVDDAFASSVVYAELDLATGALTYGSAGHTPMVLCPPDGRPRVLWDGRGPLLGIDVAPAEPATVVLERGTSVFFFTDGLVERRTRSLDRGLAQLTDLLAGDPDLAARPGDLAPLMATAEHGDDTCILVATIPAAP